MGGADGDDGGEAEDGLGCCNDFARRGVATGDEGEGIPDLGDGDGGVSGVSMWAKRGVADIRVGADVVCWPLNCEDEAEDEE